MKAPWLICALIAANLASSQCPVVTASSLDDSLRPLYDVTEKFLDVLQPVDKSLVVQEVVSKLINRTNLLIGNDVKETSLYYIRTMVGYAILICLGLLLIIVVPIAGCCVCCCRCCCNSCGGRLNYMERKGAKCRRLTYGLLSLAFATLMLFGGVYAMLANQQLHVQLRDQSSSSGGSGDTALGAFSAAFSGTMDLLESAPRQGRAAMPRVMTNLVTNLRPVLNSTLINLQTLIVNWTRADAAMAASRMTLDNLAVVQRAANATAVGHQELSNSLNNLKVTLSAMKNFTCPSIAIISDCQLLNASIVTRDSILAEPPMSTALVDLAARLQRLDTASMLASINRAEATMNNISNAGMQLFTDGITFLNDSQPMKIWNDLEITLGGFAKEKRDLSNVSLVKIFDPLSGRDSTLGSVVSAVDAYRYYVYIAIAALPLLIVLLFYLGLLYGIAGEPPYEDSGCCNRGVGARFQLAGAGLGFIFYALMMIIVIVLFVSGGAIYTEGCRYLRNRPGTDGYRRMDDIFALALRQGYLNLGGGGGGVNNFTSVINRRFVSTLLGGCSNDASLSDAIDMAQFAKMFNLNTSISKMLNDTRNKIAQQENGLTSGMSFNISSLQDLSQQAANASGTNFTHYIEKLRSTAIALEPLRAAASNISGHASAPADKERFKNLVDSVNATQALITSQIARLDHMSAVMAGLGTKASDMTAKLNYTDNAIKARGVIMSALNTATVGLDDQIIGQVTAALPDLLVQMIDCAKVGRYLRQIVDVPCVRLLQPFNGFWAGIGICLISLLPCLVLAINLANLYRKTQKYLADFDDGNPKPV